MQDGKPGLEGCLGVRASMVIGIGNSVTNLNGFFMSRFVGSEIQARGLAGTLFVAGVRKQKQKKERKKKNGNIGRVDGAPPKF
jgi:hypothetical protein